MNFKFSDLNPLGRKIIIAVAIGTGLIAAVAFAASYNAIYAWVVAQDLYSDRIERLIPLLLDAAFIVAQLAAILMGVLAGKRFWPFVMMLVSGALTIWFNLQHAGSDPGKRLLAALPPVLMMIAFEVDLAIVKRVMEYLGKPLSPAASSTPDGSSNGALSGTARPSVSAGGHVPETRNPVTESSTASAKRKAIEAYLAGHSKAELKVLTAEQVVADLKELEGITVSVRYVTTFLAAARSRRRQLTGRRR